MENSQLESAKCLFYLHVCAFVCVCVCVVDIQTIDSLVEAYAFNYKLQSPTAHIYAYVLCAKVTF